VRPRLLLALLLASCAPALDGKTAEEWAAEMTDPATGPGAFARLESHGTGAVGMLTGILGSGPPKARIQAAALLGKLGPAAAPAVPALAEALGAKEDVGVRGMAAIALGRIGPSARDALVMLDKALHDRDVRVQVAASLAIYGITDETTGPTRVLFRAFTSPDPDVRAMVADAFEEMGTPILPFLVRSLASEDETTRANAAKTLTAMGPAAEEARGALQNCLEDPSENVRAAAAAALARLDER